MFIIYVIMENYLAVKRNEVVIYVTTWMKLESMLNERNQSQTIHVEGSIYMKCPE